MRKGDQILNQFLFQRKLFSVHDDEFALMGFTQVSEQTLAEASKTVLVSKNER